MSIRGFFCFKKPRHFSYFAISRLSTFREIALLSLFGPAHLATSVPPFSCDSAPTPRYLATMRGAVKLQRALRVSPVLSTLFAASFLEAAAADSTLTRSERELPLQTQLHVTNKPHVPPWTVSRPPVPSDTPQVTPGGTFSRSPSTFSPQTGSFSRPQSTFAHPGTTYTPLPPIQVPVQHPQHPRPHRPVSLYPQTVIVHNPVIYEPYYIPVETPAPVEAAPAVQPTVEEAPVVIDLPPGATIRKPAAAQVAPAPVAPIAAAAPKPSEAQSQPSTLK